VHADVLQRVAQIARRRRGPFDQRQPPQAEVVRLLRERLVAGQEQLDGRPLLVARVVRRRRELLCI
jgi:hypothetical protein